MKRDFRFYSTLNGRIPVIEFIESLQLKEQQKINDTISALRYVDKLGYPYYKKFGNYLIDFGELLIGRYRIFVSRIDKDNYLLLHGFIKKTNETPKRESDRAYQYIVEFVNRTK